MASRIKQNMLNIGAGTQYTKGHQTARETKGVITGWSKEGVSGLIDVVALASQMPAVFPNDPHLTPRRVTTVRWQENQKAQVVTKYERRRGRSTRDQGSLSTELFDGEVTDSAWTTYFDRNGNMPEGASRKGTREHPSPPGTNGYYVLFPLKTHPIISFNWRVRIKTNPTIIWEKYHDTINASHFLGAKPLTVALRGLKWKAELVEGTVFYDVSYAFLYNPYDWRPEWIPNDSTIEAALSAQEKENGAVGFRIFDEEGKNLVTDRESSKSQGERHYGSYAKAEYTNVQ